MAALDHAERLVNACVLRSIQHAVTLYGVSPSFEIGPNFAQPVWKLKLAG